DARVLHETADHERLTLAELRARRGTPHPERGYALDRVREVRLAHFRRDREDDVAVLGDLGREVHERTECLELDLVGEAGHDADRDFTAHLEDGVLAAEREDL